MKKRMTLVLMLLISAFLLVGCTGKSKDKQLIIDTKNNLEQTMKQILKNDSLNAIAFEKRLLTASYEERVRLAKEEDNRVYFISNTGEENGKVTGADKNDSSKYYIYIGSKENKDLWSYGTVNLNTGEISWEDNF